eukprot:4367974-Ditylum_brightwellii.AAC.1
MEVIANSVGKANPMKSDGEEGKGMPGEAYSSWKYQNPGTKKTMQKGNHTLKWCTNNCHAHPIWCGQSNCLPCKEY